MILSRVVARKAKLFAQVVLSASIISLTGCGGGGEGETSSAPIVTPPVTNPAPSPSDPATIFTGALIGPITGRVTFDTSGDGIVGNASDVTVATNGAGQFGRDIASAPSLNPSVAAPTKSLYRMSASGFDNYTGHFYSGLTAPAGATVISPITSLIDAVGSEATVRAALGLNDGSLAIDPNVNLLTFDAPRELQNATTSVAHDARIVTALNLMILNLGIIGTYPATAIDNRVEVDDIVSVLASVIKKSGSARLDQETTYAAILAQLERFAFIQDRSFPAASGILRDYWNFVMPQIADETSLYRSASLFRYYLASVAIHAADEFYSPVKQSVSLAELQTMMAYTAEVPQPNVASGFYALPDYMDLSFNSLLLKDCTTRPAHPKCNDYNQLDGSQGAGADTLTVTDVSVPQSGNLISVQLNVDGSILIERKPMALGLAYFNYVVKNAEGKTSTSRYYITLHRNW